MTDLNIMHSYPKSGKTWTETRLIVYLDKCHGINISNGTELNQYMIRDHLANYAFHSTKKITRNPDVVHGYKDHPKVFVLLRDARQVLNAIYRREIKSVVSDKSDAPFIADEFGDPIRADDFPSDPDSFISSCYGISRYVDFLNDIALMESRRKINKPYYLYYEDMFYKESVQVLPIMLGRKYSLSEKEINHIFNTTEISFLKRSSHPFVQQMVNRRHIREGDMRAYADLFSADTLDYIQQYILVRCKLNAYLRRYLCRSA